MKSAVGEKVNTGGEAERTGGGVKVSSGSYDYDGKA